MHNHPVAELYYKKKELNKQIDACKIELKRLTDQLAICYNESIQDKYMRVFSLLLETEIELSYCNKRSFK